MAENPQPQQEIIVKIPDHALEGKYSNLVNGTVTKEDFSLDFYYIKPPTGGVLLARIVLSPSHAKRLAILLNKQIAEYEEKWNEIEAIEEPKVNIGFEPTRKQ